jgi:hypothetical protein
MPTDQIDPPEQKESASSFNIQEYTNLARMYIATLLVMGWNTEMDASKIKIDLVAKKQYETLAKDINAQATQMAMFLQAFIYEYELGLDSIQDPSAQVTLIKNDLDRIINLNKDAINAYLNAIKAVIQEDLKQRLSSTSGAENVH